MFTLGPTAQATLVNNVSQIANGDAFEKKTEDGFSYVDFFHTWMPQLAMNGKNWMDAIPRLIKCCVGLQTMVTCGRR